MFGKCIEIEIKIAPLMRNKKKKQILRRNRTVKKLSVTDSWLFRIRFYSILANLKNKMNMNVESIMVIITLMDY